MNQACNRASTEHDFGFTISTQPRTQTFSIRLENESRVGTPLCRNLPCIMFCRIYLVLWLSIRLGPAHLFSNYYLAGHPPARNPTKNHARKLNCLRDLGFFIVIGHYSSGHPCRPINTCRPL